MKKIELQTPRLRLSSIDVLDLNNVHELHSLKETDEFNTLGLPENFKVTETLINSWICSEHSYIFSVKLNESNQFVGLTALVVGKPHFRTGEVWYKTLPTFWRKGYTSEALKTILEFGFCQLFLHRIEAGCAIENAGSIKILQKAGFTREGAKRKALPIRGEWVDSYTYAMLETEFNDSLINRMP